MTSVFLGMLGSTIPVSILGIRFAMSVEPFWKPEQYSKHQTCSFSTDLSRLSMSQSSRGWYVMRKHNFWDSYRGIICVEGYLVSITYLLLVLIKTYSHLTPSENRDKIEMYLAFGASRFEACKPIAKEALRLALTPNINQMRSADSSHIMKHELHNYLPPEPCLCRLIFTA